MNWIQSERKQSWPNWCIILAFALKKYGKPQKHVTISDIITEIRTGHISNNSLQLYLDLLGHLTCIYIGVFKSNY